MLRFTSVMAPLKERPQFTKGEKCIFIHLIVTFLILLILIVIFFVHLCLVNHRGDEIFRVSRRSLTNQSSPTFDRLNVNHLVGTVFLNVTPLKTVCNSLLLRRQWSLAPAHCVAIYSDPDMADLITSWRLKYKTYDIEFKETEIKRNIIHSQFSRDDFSNNIGLFEHSEPILTNKYAVLSKNFKANEFLLRSLENMRIVYWSVDLVGRSFRRERNIKAVRLMSKQKCKDYVLPIVEKLRNYEFCVTLTPRKESLIYHGAAVFVDTEVVGIFSWGDKSGTKLPFIILNTFYFSNWLENIIDI